MASSSIQQLQCFLWNKPHRLPRCINQTKFCSYSDMQTGIKSTWLGVFIRAKQVMRHYVCIKHTTMHHSAAALSSASLSQSVLAALQLNKNIFETTPASVSEIHQSLLTLLLEETNWRHRVSFCLWFLSPCPLSQKMCCRIRNASENSNMPKEHFRIISTPAIARQAVPGQDFGEMWQRSELSLTVSRNWLICLLFLQTEYLPYIILRHQKEGLKQAKELVFLFSVFTNTMELLAKRCCGG